MEKHDTIKRLLLSSPPGQIHKVLEDLESICGEKVDEDLLKEVFNLYNCETTLSLPVPGNDTKLLVCEEAKVDATHFYDPVMDKVYDVNPVTHAVVQTEPSDTETDPAYAQQRQSIKDALERYDTASYMNNATMRVYAKESAIHIVVNTERVNLRNFWSGRWVSRWRVDMTPNPCTVHGDITLDVHYFEDGNLQLGNTQHVDETLPCDMTSVNFGTAVVDIMRKVEDALQEQLEELYINMSQETLKEMRRIMPVTHTKMDWRLCAHRTAKDLTRTKHT